MVRGDAAFTLGNPKFSKACELLISALKDENINVRRLALLGLGARIKDPLNVGPFVSVALMDTDGDVKEIAMNTLLDLKEPFPKTKNFLALSIEIYKIERQDTFLSAFNSESKIYLLVLDCPGYGLTDRYHYATSSLIFFYLYYAIISLF